MKKFTILQAIAGNFFAEEMNMADYTRIADIECDSLDDAYALSQNIVSNGWLTLKSVTPYGNILKARSTSVGDIIYSQETDKYHMVENIGFSELKIENSMTIKAVN